MRRKKHADLYARICYLIIASLVLYVANSLKIFSEKDATWTASGIKVLWYEYVAFVESSEGVTIRLTNTPWLKTTYFQIEDKVSIAKRNSISDRFFVQQYKVDVTGDLTLCDSYEVIQTENHSNFYSPLLTGEGYKKGYRLYTDFGVYEIT